MISVDEAIAIILERASGPPPDGVSTVRLAEAVGRVLAAPIVADVDLPPFSRSTVDGFALRAADAPALAAGAAGGDLARLAIAGESAAGKPASVEVAPGTAVRIFTGAALPTGADAVIMVEDTREDTREDAGFVSLLAGARPGQNISTRGEDLKRGEIAAASGVAVSSGLVGLLASLGAAQVAVHRRPRVAILPTGTELVPPDRTPGPGQIRESNGATLAALVRLAGCEPIDLGITHDDRALITERATAGLECDFLLVSGGSSVGDYDYTPDVLKELGVAVHFDRVALKPGKPTLFGTRGDRLVFGLPGNPISAFVTFHLFVRPALRVRAGLRAEPPPWLAARLAARVKRAPGRDQALPARLTLADGEPVVAFAGWHGSGDVTCLAEANALLFVPMGRGSEGPLEAGERVRVTPLDAGRAGDFAFGFAT